VNGPRKLVLAVMFVILATGFSAAASAANIYIAQNAVGGNTGADCADAYAASWFNSSANWGSGAGQIGPGTTVHLCSGTYSFPGGTSCGLSFQGSGSSGSPITLVADQGVVTITAPYWDGSANGGAICASGYNYITINGVSKSNLVLQASANGSGLANQADYAFGVWALSSNNLIVENLTVSNIYVHTQCVSPYTGCDEGGQNTGGIAAQGSNVTITGNVIHDAKWCLTGGVGGNVTVTNRVISNNTIYDCDHGVAVGVGDTNGVLNGLLIYGNDISNAYVWDDNPSVNNNHHDGIHIWSYNPGDSITGARIYNNYEHGNWGASCNSAIFVEAVNSSCSPTNCLVSPYFFNNILIDQSTESHQGCGNICLESTGATVVNNTIDNSGASGGGSVAFNQDGGGSTVFENNTINGANGTVAFPNGYSGNTSDYNNYSNIGGGGWNNGGSFSSWKSSCSCDSHSNGNAPDLNASWQPTSSSTSLIAEGTNLTSLSITALGNDFGGNARPSGACAAQGTPTCWTIGAYQYGSGNQSPAAPTGLAAVVE
jgi:hypothetical protein